MKVSPAFERRLHWINLPTAALIALLQRTPVVRVAIIVEDFVLSSRIGAVLKSTFAASAAIGTVHSLAGATALSTSKPSPLSVPAGTAVSVGFAITGTLSAPESWTVSGNVPPGLAFNGGVTSGTIAGSELLLTGTPTTAGDYTITLRATDQPTGQTSAAFSYVINVTGAANAAPTIATQPVSQVAAAGGTLTLTVAVNGTPAPTVQWRVNGADVAGATNPALAIVNVQPGNAGIYVAAASNTGGSTVSAPAIAGVTTNAKVIGTGTELTPVDVVHPNGNVFDQVLVNGAAEAITAEFAQNQITRTSFIDVDDDIVQVEFSGPGTLSLVLDGAAAPAAPTRYNQQVNYVKGHAGIVITGADERTNVSVFTVGRATAFDPTGAFNIVQPISATNNPANNGSPLFQGHAGTTYDGVADIAFIAIVSTNGRFGGIRTSNANYIGAKGHVGIVAPGVAFSGPVFVGDISTADDASPVLLLGSAADVRVTGGDMFQASGRPVAVSGVTQLRFTAGGDSHGNALPAVPNRATFHQNGQDVTAQIVVNP